MIQVHPFLYRMLRWMRRRTLGSIMMTVLLVLVVCGLYRLMSDVYYHHKEYRQDLNSISMSRYTWPLEVDTAKVIAEYKRGNPSIYPITRDNTSIVVYPDKQQCKSHVLVTVLIKTRAGDRYNRDLLRRTWVSDLHKHDMRHAFLLGQCTSMKCITTLSNEMADHKDIIQGDFIDAYYNNTLKFSIGLKYVAYHCNKTRYALIIDGDYSLNVKRLAEYLEMLKFPKNLYAGQLWPNTRPFREPEHKQYLTYKFYPFRYLPPFIAAGASLLSVEIVESLHIVSQYTKFVPFDDVFYGMVAKKLSIPLTDASDMLPSWFIPNVWNISGHEAIIGSHRFGNLSEVEIIHNMIHSGKSP